MPFQVDANDAAMLAGLGPGAVEGRRPAMAGTARPAVRALERHAPLDAGFEAGASPLW